MAFLYEAVTTENDQLGVRGLGAVRDYCEPRCTWTQKPDAPYFLKKNLVTYFHEKPIKKMEMTDLKYELKRELRTEGPSHVVPTEVINRSRDTLQSASRDFDYSFTEESTFTLCVI